MLLYIHLVVYRVSKKKYRNCVGCISLANVGSHFYLKIFFNSLRISSLMALYFKELYLRMTSPRNSSQQQRMCKRSPNILTSGIWLCLGHSICCNSFWIGRRSINNLTSWKIPPSWQTIILYVRARGRTAIVIALQTHLHRLYHPLPHTQYMLPLQGYSPKFDRRSPHQW